jgi:hypothetical protein
MKQKLLISFSGGRTSAYMLWWLFNEWPDRDNWDKIVVFANTGKEVEGTLFFVDECSQEWDIPIIWVEAKCKDENGKPFSDKGWAVKHRIVTYETASRKGEPFEEMISMLGIPSTEAPFCSYQLKREAIKSYAKSIGWNDYYTAIGIRYDEAEDRVIGSWISNKLFYPFVFEKQVTDDCEDVSVFIKLAIDIAVVVFTIIGSLALAVFIYGGFTLILSEGSPEKVKKGTGAMMAAIIGLAIVFGAYLLVTVLSSAIGIEDKFNLLK